MTGQRPPPVRRVPGGRRPCECQNCFRKHQQNTLGVRVVTVCARGRVCASGASVWSACLDAFGRPVGAARRRDACARHGCTGRVVPANAGSVCHSSTTPCTGVLRLSSCCEVALRPWIQYAPAPTCGLKSVLTHKPRLRPSACAELIVSVAPAINMSRARTSTSLTTSQWASVARRLA
jgi:hypothetical protein